MSFALCSIHILFNPNEFHEFWMSCDCRSRCTKIEQIWAKSQADRPLLGRPAWHLQKHGPSFNLVAMRHTHKAQSQGLGSGSTSIQRSTRQPKIKYISATHFPGEGTRAVQNLGKPRGRDGPEGDRLASPTPAGLAHATAN